MGGACKVWDRPRLPPILPYSRPLHEDGRDACEDYVLHKDEIHEGLGWQWWGDMVSSAERKERVKALFNRLENEGSLHGHYTQFNIPENQATDISRMNVSLSNGRTFRLQQYIAVQKRRTEWLWNEMPSMALGRRLTSNGLKLEKVHECQPHWTAGAVDG